RNPKRPGEDAVKLNINTTRLIVREALGTPNAKPDEIDTMSSAVFTAKLVRDYQRRIVDEISKLKDRYEESDEDINEEALLAPKHRANRYRAFARSLFSEKMLRSYPDVGVELPDVSGFINEPGFEDAEQVRSEYRPAPPELIAKTFNELDRLKKEDP